MAAPEIAARVSRPTTLLIPLMRVVALATARLPLAMSTAALPPPPLPAAAPSLRLTEPSRHQGPVTLFVRKAPPRWGAP
jgi:hypothetical protein